MNGATKVLFAWLVLATACSDDRVTGNSVETESDITARRLMVDSLLSEWSRPVGGLTVATIRLDSGNFDFSKTRDDGSDVRVQRGDGSPVPFHLDVWDVVARIGRLSVRIDSSLRLPTIPSCSGGATPQRRAGRIPSRLGTGSAAPRGRR